MIGQGVAEECRQAWRDHRGRLLRTTSLRGPMDSPAAQVSAPLPPPENDAEKATGTREPTLGDTGFFETSDDYGECQRAHKLWLYQSKCLTLPLLYRDLSR